MIETRRPWVIIIEDVLTETEDDDRKRQVEKREVATAARKGAGDDTKR